MARTARVESSTGYYHVIMRGNNKIPIFKTDKNKTILIEMLKQQEQDGKIELLAWCMMDNHVHIVLKAELSNMSSAFRSINIKYAMRYNQTESSIGHVFQDRFRSEPIESDTYLMQVIRYVHNNPVQAQIVEKPSDYKWSSYPTYIKKGKTALSDQMQVVLNYFDNKVSSFKAFHHEQDDQYYLEIKEDLIKYQNEKAKQIMRECYEKYDIAEGKQLAKNKEALEDIIQQLIKGSAFSLRKIANLIEVPYSSVQQINRRMKTEKEHMN